MVGILASIKSVSQKGDGPRRGAGKNEGDRQKKLKPISTGLLLHVHNLPNCVTRIQHKNYISTTFQDMQHFQASQVQPRTKNSHKISCECRAVCIHVMSHTTECTKKHQRDIRFYQPEHSAVAEHSVNQHHHTNFEVTKALAKLLDYPRRPIQEATYIRTITDKVDSS
jgi:hypothetical protein